MPDDSSHRRYDREFGNYYTRTHNKNWIAEQVLPEDPTVAEQLIDAARQAGEIMRRIQERAAERRAALEPRTDNTDRGILEHSHDMADCVRDATVETLIEAGFDQELADTLGRVYRDIHWELAYEPVFR